jgi:protein-S-isoprenylcysteine O-methyltransferase Ste14
MDKPSTFIYTGLFIIVLGLGDDKGRLIPNEYVWILGGLGLIYGIFLQLKQEGKIFPANTEWKFDLRKLPSKAYIIIGVGLLKMNRYIDVVDQYLELNIIATIVGALIMLYGLSIFFREKRIKKESGNIE